MGAHSEGNTRNTTTPCQPWKMRKQRKTQGSVGPHGKLADHVGKPGNRVGKLGKRMETLGKRRPQNLAKTLEDKEKRKNEKIDKQKKKDEDKD